jgi:hypothetical protein
VVDSFTATWYLRNSNSPGAPDVAPFAYGAAGWVPVAGDWNGDGSDTVGVYQPGAAFWYLRNSNTPGAPDGGAFAYGMGHWAPVAGRWREALGQALLADHIGPGAAPITAADLGPVAEAARLLAGRGADLVAPPVRLTDLPGRQLGLYDGAAIWLDADAAGHGWFVDLTPSHEEEFAGGFAAGAAPGRMDLLTVLRHELGHALGLEDLDPAAHPGDVMAATLAPGSRRSS